MRTTRDRGASSRRRAPQASGRAEAERPAEELATRRIRGYPERDLWTGVPEDVTVPLPIRPEPRATARKGDPRDPARAAWIRFLDEEKELPPEEAARLWEADPPLIGREMFAAGYASSERDVRERDRKLALGADDLRQMGMQVEALLTELEERYRELERIEAELAGARRALRAASVIAAAGSRPDVAGDPKRLAEIAAEVLADIAPARESRAADEDEGPAGADAEDVVEEETPPGPDGGDS